MRLASAPSLTSASPQNLIRSMLSLDPTSRLSCADYLSQNRGTVFPDIFYTFLHPFISSLNECSTSAPAPPSTPTPPIGRVTTGTSTSAGAGDTHQQQQSTLRSDADDRLERVWTEWEMISEYLGRGEKEEDRSPEAAETSKAGRGEVCSTASVVCRGCADSS